MIDLFGNEIEEKPAEAKPEKVKPDRTINPCLALYGSGPDGQTCQNCVHLRYRPQANPNARFWKCDLRTLTNGKATDHKVRWQSCARYQKREGEYHGG